LGVGKVGHAVNELVADAGRIDDDLGELREDGGGERGGRAMADEDDAGAVNLADREDAGDVVLDAALRRDAGEEIRVLIRGRGE